MPTVSTMKYTYKSRKPMRAFRTKKQASKYPIRRRKFASSLVKNLFPRQLTCKLVHFKDLPNITVPGSGSLRRVWYNSIAPYSTVDNALAIGSFAYQQTPVNPDTFLNGIPQYCDIYGTSTMMWSKLYIQLINVTNSAAGTTLNLSMVLVPVSPDSDDAGDSSITQKINQLDGFTFSQLASLKGARSNIIGHAAGGPNKWVVSSRILTRAYLGLKDVNDQPIASNVFGVGNGYGLKEKLPDTSTLQSGRRSGDSSQCAYYLRIFNNNPTDTNITAFGRFTGICRLSNLSNSGQQQISA